MQMLQVIVSAVVGGAIGFAASHTISQREDPAPLVAAATDAAVDKRLEALGVQTTADLDGRISGGVAQFLNDNPEAVIAAIRRFQENEQAKEALEKKNALKTMQDALTGQAADPSFGASAADADITVVEFFDYRCGYCKRALDGVVALAEEDPKVRVVLKEFPILGAESMQATLASLAANKINPALYMPFHQALMRHRGSYDDATLLGLAAASGYNPVELAQAMKSDEITAQVRHTYETAEALGIRSTPAFIIGDQIIPGAVGKEAMQNAIKDARAS